MLCTNCSEAIKPVVALDIDGTMAPFHDHFLRFAIGYMTGKSVYNSPYEEYDGSIGFRQWFCRRFQTNEAVWRDIKLAYRQGAQKRTMPCNAWVHMLTAELREAGAEVWVTTTRPYLRLDNIDPDTRFWLDNNKVWYDYLIYDEDKYQELMSRVGVGRVVAVVEDLPDQLNRAASLFGASKVMMYRGPHNKTLWDIWPQERIAHEGICVKRFVMAQVNEWMIKNGK